MIKYWLKFLIVSLIKSRKILSGEHHAVFIIWSFQKRLKTDLTREGKNVVDADLGLGYTVDYCDYVLCQKTLKIQEVSKSIPVMSCNFTSKTQPTRLEEIAICRKEPDGTGRFCYTSHWVPICELNFLVWSLVEFMGIFSFFISYWQTLSVQTAVLLNLTESQYHLGWKRPFGPSHFGLGDVVRVSSIKMLRVTSCQVLNILQMRTPLPLWATSACVWLTSQPKKIKGFYCADQISLLLVSAYCLLGTVNLHY